VIVAETDTQTQEVCLVLRLLDGDGSIGLSDLMAVVTPLRRAVRALVSVGPKAGRPTDELRDATELSLRLAAGSTVLTFAPSTDAALSLAPGACEQLVVDLRTLERGHGHGLHPPPAYSEPLAELLGAISRLGPVQLGTSARELSPFAADAARAALPGPSGGKEAHVRVRGTLVRGDLMTGTFAVRDDLGEVWPLTLGGDEALLAAAEAAFGRRVDVEGTRHEGRGSARVAVIRLTAAPVGAGWGTGSRLVRRGAVVTGAGYAAMGLPDLADDEAEAFLRAIDDL